MSIATRTTDAAEAPLRTRKNKHSDTRDLIFAVAIAEIAERGLSGARIEHIARKASVTRPTVYAHFPKKEDFLLELEARSQAQTLRVVQERLDGASGVELLHRLVDALFDLIEAAHPVLRREVFALLVREPARVDWSENPFFGFLTYQLGVAQTRGEVADGAAPSELTQIIMKALFGFLTIEGDPAATRRRTAHQMIDLVVSRV